MFFRVVLQYVGKTKSPYVTFPAASAQIDFGEQSFRRQITSIKVDKFRAGLFPTWFDVVSGIFYPLVAVSIIEAMLKQRKSPSAEN